MLLTVGQVTHAPSPRCNLPASSSRAVTERSRGENLQSTALEPPPALILSDIRSGGVCVQANELNIHTYFTP